MPYRINGQWQVIWNPPSTTEPIPTPAPEACLTLDKWEQIKSQHEALPAGLGGKILFTTDAMSPDINVFIANLDGSDPRGLLSDYYPSLSPDGTHIAFMTQDVGLNILDLGSGQTVSLGNGTNPVWSPDGLRIMFQNPPDGLYLVNTDGTGLQKIETGSPRINPIGWLPDNQTIVYGAQVGDIYNLYEHVFKTYNLQTGETKALFPITIKTPTGAVSPDGQWIAYNARQFGANLGGSVFISRLDGSERKLVAMLDNTLAYHPVWSPDTLAGTGGQWLIVSVIEPYKPTSPVLVNPFTCQVVRLENIRGEVQSWR
jgi:Tol biopolymer transport system component